MSKIEARLKDLDITLPSPNAPVANYVPYVVTGNMVFISGQVTMAPDGLKFVGKLGADISLDAVGTPCVVTGTVRSLDGTPLPGALVDVWQANGDGFYDVQQPDLQPEANLRGLFTADDKGGFWFRSVVPRYYPIPQDGPVAELLRATGRHPYRPAHIHFIGGAEGHAPVTTHMFLQDSPYLDSDAVFGVKRSLVRPVTVVDDAARAAAYGVEAPFRLIEFDIVLTPATAS